ncbi:hypothetical protein F2Q70_00016956 [Brassica cretica]|uniref:Uncharacterized protein n=1 Tax=Brassica cretica TaxID=69181 RepID=A0A8S9HYC1_BRACR|nr:hypothetical protein F2Q70_00016956 [Brassica cretica]KAF2597414.1 hypothetical protein F2Q68_00009916 [Brassica cretica]
MSHEQMNFMRVSHMRNFSTFKDVMKQNNTEQKLLGKKHVSAILSREPTVRRPEASTSIDRRNNKLTDIHRQT